VPTSSGDLRHRNTSALGRTFSTSLKAGPAGGRLRRPSSVRSCITGARLTISDVAAQVGVDPKTVERWIVLGRVPHRSHRWATASLLGTDEAYLWPEIADDRRTQATSTAELVTLYPNRGAVAKLFAA
jgi:hypothetical protein